MVQAASAMQDGPPQPGGPFFHFGANLVSLPTALQSRERPFVLSGEVLPLTVGAYLDLQKGGWKPKRAMAGWLATYGRLGKNGGIVPVVDREGQNFEAAKGLGRIDFSEYLRKGVWNHTHNEDVLVGLPTNLEFHDGSTELSKAHGKVGFWTEGHLFDRNDPESWKGLGRTPRPDEFAGADHFWNLANLLKGTPRPIALSAHGKMALSPCGKRIIWAKVTQSAVCECPMNPDATLEPLELGSKESIYSILRKGMVGAPPCGRCSCPAGACQGLLKGADPALVSEDLEEKAEDPMVKKLMVHFNADRATAERWTNAHRKTHHE